MFMRHQDEEHGKYPIQKHYHKDMLKALLEQMDLSPDYVFPCDVSYGYIESCKRRKLVGGPLNLQPPEDVRSPATDSAARPVNGTRSAFSQCCH